MQLQRRTLLKGIFGSASLGALAMGAHAGAESPALIQGGTVLAQAGNLTPLVPGMAMAQGVPLLDQTGSVTPITGEKTAADLLDQQYRAQFPYDYFKATIAPQNLDALFVQLLTERPAEFPLLAALTRTIETGPVVMAVRRARNLDTQFGDAHFERLVYFVTHLDAKAGRSHQYMVMFNDGATTQDTAQNHAETVQAVVDREGALGVMRRIEWALLHADGNADFEGMVNTNPATVYRGLLATATPLWDGRITQQEQATLARDVTMLNDYVGFPLRHDGRLLSFAKVIVLVPPWYAERTAQGDVMTNFGTLRVVPSPYLHNELLAFNNDERDVNIAQGGPLTRLPMAVVTTRVESLYYLRHTVIAKAPQRILRIPVLPPDDVSMPDLSPPPYDQPETRGGMPDRA
jgi:hypothetical protein